MSLGAQEQHFVKFIFQMVDFLLWLLLNCAHVLKKLCSKSSKQLVRNFFSTTAFMKTNEKKKRIWNRA